MRWQYEPFMKPLEQEYSFQLRQGLGKDVGMSRFRQLIRNNDKPLRGQALYDTIEQYCKCCEQAHEWKNVPAPHVTMVSFGQPRVGNHPFAQDYGELHPCFTCQDQLHTAQADETIKGLGIRVYLLNIPSSAMLRHRQNP